jgi:hypothetical protein
MICDGRFVGCSLTSIVGGDQEQFIRQRVFFQTRYYLREGEEGGPNAQCKCVLVSSWARLVVQEARAEGPTTVTLSGNQFFCGKEFSPGRSTHAPRAHHATATSQRGGRTDHISSRSCVATLPLPTSLTPLDSAMMCSSSSEWDDIWRTSVKHHGGIIEEPHICRGHGSGHRSDDTQNMVLVEADGEAEGPRWPPCRHDRYQGCLDGETRRRTWGHEQEKEHVGERENW